MLCWNITWNPNKPIKHFLAVHLYISISFIWAYEGFSFLSLLQADSHPERQTELQSCVLFNNFTSVSLSACQTCGLFNVTSVILDDSSCNLKALRENWLKKIKESSFIFRSDSAFSLLRYEKLYLGPTCKTAKPQCCNVLTLEYFDSEKRCFWG